MSQSFLCACEERSADTLYTPPLSPTIARQSTLSNELHVQRTFGDENLAALIFGFLHPRDRVMATSTCKQHLAHRPRDPTPWANARMYAVGRAISCDELLFTAKLAEQAERYDEMVRLMRRLVEDTETRDLTLEERNLFTIAYKKVIIARCTSLRCIDTCIQSESERSAEPVSTARLDVARSYRQRVAVDAGRLCADMLRLLDTLIARVRPDGFNIESHVFYLKCKADYLRHFAHLSWAPNLDAQVEAGYSAAVEVAKRLAPSHPVRIGTILNWATELAGVRGRHEEAAKLLNGLLEDVIAELPTLDEESYKDTRSMLDLVQETMRFLSLGETGDAW